MVENVKDIINEALSKSIKFECFSYREQLLITLKELNNEQEKSTLGLFIDILSYSMNLDKPKEPFEPFAIFDGRRSAALSDLTENDFELMKKLYCIIDDCEIKARVADILWVTKRSYIHAQEAVEHYLKSATRLEDLQHWTGVHKRIKRALQISLMLGKNNHGISIVNSYIESLIRKIDGDDPLYLSGKLMELLQEQRLGNYKEYINIVERIISNSNDLKTYDRSRYYLEIKSRWHQLDKDNQKYQESIIDIARSYEYEAQNQIDLNSDGAYIQIVYLLEHAISTYRRLPSMQLEINRLLKDISQYKEKMRSNFKSFSHKIDITEIVKSINETISGRPLIDALIKLAYIEEIPKKDSLKTRVNELQQMSPLSFLVSTDIVDKDGKRIVKMPDLRTEDEEQRKQAMEAYMLKEAASNHAIFASVIVSNALEIIKKEHSICEDELEILFADNVFIQNDRKRIFSKGIYEGLKGNYMVAIHLLIPQLENSFREFARLCGDVVTTFEDDGKEQVKPLNSVFELENFVSSYDEDLLFNLRSLLTEKYGSNLRNRLAHGLLDDDDSESAIAVYLWWISLRLCCMYSKGIYDYIDKNIENLKT